VCRPVRVKRRSPRLRVRQNQRQTDSDNGELANCSTGRPQRSPGGSVYCGGQAVMSETMGVSWK